MSKLTAYLVMAVVTIVFPVIGIYGSRETAGLMLLAGGLHIFGDGLPYLADAYNEYWVQNPRRSWEITLWIQAINSTFLFASAVYVSFEAADRYQRPYVVGSMVIVYAAVEIVGNSLQVWCEHELKHKREHDHHQHIHESNWWHLVGDVATSILQLGGAVGIVVFGSLWADPFASVGGSILMFILCLKGFSKFVKLAEAGPNAYVGHTHKH